MRSPIVTFLSLAGLFLATVNVGAVPPLTSAQLTTPGTTRTLVLPPAADSAPVISLGTGLDPTSGKLVEGYAIIHYREGALKPAKPPRGGGTKCYGFLAQGAKWKTMEAWVVNPANSEGLASDYLLANLSQDVSKWEDAVDGTTGDGNSVEILGLGSSTDSLLVADTSSPDGVNEVYFGDVSTQNAIAVTVVWGIFSGPTWNRQLVEWDQIYDEVDYDWSSSGEPAKMDFENIATHELGHSVGMADLYELACSEQTMYGYADYGETKKRSLESSDITGVSTLY